MSDEPEEPKRGEPRGSKTLDQQIVDARRILDARLAKKRKLENRGKQVIIDHVLRTAEDDHALDRRIREIVAGGVRNERDRNAVEAVLGPLGKSGDDGRSDGGDRPGGGHGGQDPGSDGPHGGGWS